MNEVEAPSFGGIKTVKHSAICLETQKPPNSINYPEFSDYVVLNPGQSYYHKTVHRFGFK